MEVERTSILKENQSWSKYLQPTGGEDIEIVMSYNARGENYQMDDLRLIVNTSDGKFALDDNFSSEIIVNCIRLSSLHLMLTIQQMKLQ